MSSSKLGKFVNWRMKITISEKRSFIGTFLAFDKHMNIVLVDAEETRKIKTKAGEEKELKRPLGLIILRGEHVISVTVDAPPLPKPKLPIFKVPQGQTIATPGPRLGQQTTAPTAQAPPVAPMGLVGHIAMTMPGGMPPMGMAPMPGMMPGMPPMGMPMMPPMGMPMMPPPPPGPQ